MDCPHISHFTVMNVVVASAHREILHSSAPEARICPREPLAQDHDFAEHAVNNLETDGRLGSTSTWRPATRTCILFAMQTQETSL